MVVCEGAGSPAEINLRRNDYVNMGLAQHGRIPTVLVGDIDRGGVFAAMHGTLALLDAADQALMAGFVVNKFRGDVSLLRPGLDTLERLTGRPVHGVLPWLRDLWLDSEDSLALRDRATSAPDADRVTDRLRVAVVVLPRISNFTDVDALCLEPGLDVVFADSPRALASADVVVLPGTRATLEDLAWLRARGLADAVATHVARGGAVLGICGGFQMLGRQVLRPRRCRGHAGCARRRARPARRTYRVRPPRRCCACRPGRRWRCPRRATRSTTAGWSSTRARPSWAEPVPARCSARCGTAVSRATTCAGRWLAEVAGRLDVPFTAGTQSFAAVREARIDALADAMEEHLDLDALLDLVASGAPRGRPVVRGGLA